MTLPAYRQEQNYSENLLSQGLLSGELISLLLQLSF